MTDLVEKVARAIAVENGGGSEMNWADPNDEAVIWHRDIAKTAVSEVLGSIRDLDDGAARAGHDLSQMYLNVFGDLSVRGVKVVFAASIDHLMRETND